MTLSEQVGAPSYIRTPNFNKNDSAVRHQYRRKKKNQEISDDDWDAIRNFQATVIEKKEGLDKSIELIRKHLNKITNINYEVHRDGIITIINELVDLQISEEDKNRIGESIFTIASGNKFYSEVYAKLYKDLIQKYDFMESIFIQNMNIFNEIFDDIEYCSPEEDYNKFCEINKKNDKRKATSNFYVNLFKVGVLECNQIVSVILNFQKKMNDLLTQENKINEIEEISENLFILITIGYESVKDHADWKDIYDNIVFVSELTQKSKPSISNKVIFKHMDILDEIN